MGRIPAQPFSRTLAILGLLVMAAGLGGVDRSTYSASIHLNHPGTVDPADFYHRTILFWDACRIPATPYAGVLIYLLIVGFHPKGIRAANLCLIAFLAAGAVTYLLQHTVGRIRPNQAHTWLEFAGPIRGWTEHLPVCFPSGEATASFALAAIVAWCVPRMAWIVFAAASLTAAARIVPGCHYLADVAAGGIVGGGVVTLMLRRLKAWARAEDPDIARPDRDKSRTVEQIDGTHPGISGGAV